MSCFSQRPVPLTSPKMLPGSGLASAAWPGASIRGLEADTDPFSVRSVASVHAHLLLIFLICSRSPGDPPIPHPATAPAAPCPCPSAPPRRAPPPPTRRRTAWQGWGATCSRLLLRVRLRQDLRVCVLHKRGSKQASGSQVYLETFGTIF